MKTYSLILILCVFIFGCSTSPEIVNRKKLDKISDKAMPLTGYHRDYLGSDDDYHYIRVGIATGDSIYMIKKSELFIIGEYEYSETNTRSENLLKKTGNYTSNQSLE